MYLSITLDVTAVGPAGESIQAYRARAAEIERHGADLVLLAAEDVQGRIAPPAVEALIDVAWITATLETPVVAAGLPGLHSVPFHVARALSAADFLSGGRTGFMPIAGCAEVRDAAYDATVVENPAEADARIDDFIRATRALWDSWDDDALILDKESGRYLDSTKVRRVDYRGRYFSTMGPLNAARPPQGHPLLVRDLADRPTTSEPEDIVIGDEAALSGIGSGPIRLLRTLSDPSAAARRVEAGVADGLHLSGPNALAMLAGLGAVSGAGPVVSGRRRFGLAHPVNPFSRSAA